MKIETLECKNIISKNFEGDLVFSMDSLSFVGGVDIKTGNISDYRHKNYKENITNKIFAFPFGKGSSGAGLVLMEMMRIKTAPAVLINIYTDPVILTGPLICKYFYDEILSVINLSKEDYQKLDGAKKVKIYENENKIDVFY